MFPFEVFADSPGLAFIALCILFLLFLAVFARVKTGWVLLGFLRIIGTLFAEPVRYLNRIILQHAKIGAGNLKEAPGPGKGLLATLLLYLQVTVAVGAIGILSVGTLAAWKAFRPPPGTAERLADGRKSLDAARKELESKRDSLKVLESAIGQKKAEAVTRFKSEHQQAIKDATLAMSNAEKAARLDPAGADNMGKISRFLADKSSPTTTWEPQDPKEKVESYINDNVPEGSPSRAPLQNYIDEWFRKMVAQVELATFDENQIVRQVEAERIALGNAIAERETQLAEMTGQIGELENEASFRPRGALLALALAAGQFLGFIWAFGLLLEILELTLRLAGNLQEIRDSTVKGRSSLPAPDVEQALTEV